MNFYPTVEYIIGIISIFLFAKNIFNVKRKKVFIFLSVFLLAVSMLITLFVKNEENNMDYGISSFILILGLTFLPCILSGVKKFYLLFSSILFSGLIFFFASIYPLIMSIINMPLSVETDKFLNFLSNLIAMGIFILLATVMKNKTTDFIMAVSKMTIILITSFLYIGGMLNLMGTYIESPDKFQLTVLKVTILAVSLIFLISMPVLTYNQIKKSQYMYASKLYEQQLNTQIEYYKNIAVSGYELKKFRHDYFNLSEGVKKYIGEGRPQAALQLVEKYDVSILESFEILYNTGCDIADAILTDKQLRAKENIKITFEGNLKKIRTDSLDICILLNNTLDIAIKLSENCDSHLKHNINVISNFRGGFLFYTITSPINNERKSENNTTEYKLAFETLQKLVDKNAGEMKLSHTDNKSIIDIMYAY